MLVGTAIIAFLKGVTGYPSGVRPRISTPSEVERLTAANAMLASVGHSKDRTIYQLEQELKVCRERHKANLAETTKDHQSHETTIVGLNASLQQQRALVEQYKLSEQVQAKTIAEQAEMLDAIQGWFDALLDYVTKYPNRRVVASSNELRMPCPPDVQFDRTSLSIDDLGVIRVVAHR